MEIKDVKNLCGEHDIISKTVKLIEDVSKENYWVTIKTPKGESYLSDNQIRIVLADARNRIGEIEKTINKV
jgi:hypothetical protein